MKDQILKSFVSNFVEENDLHQMDEDKAFERFVNFNIISRLYPRDVDIEDLSTGGGDDIALDGVAIIVNGNIIKNEEEIEFLCEKNGTLDVTFALVQSKASAKFKGDQIGNFIFGVKSFFDDRASIPENKKIQKLRSLKEKVYKHSIDFESNPELRLFFATTGEWKEPDQIIGKVRRELKELDAKSLFRNEAAIDFYDAERLKATYREISRKTVKEIPFNNHVALPDMPNDLNVRQSYIGSISVKSYLKLITNSDNALSKELFYDNVRDYQGFNKINQEIQETLRSPTNQALLCLMNNGITIISKKVEKVGSKMKLTDFQIVNGCQSSHVLFENRSEISNDTHLVLKVIETVDQEVTNNIIRATNRQTEVKDEAFESLKSFHKDLEEFYKAKSRAVKPEIYYERRSKEYLGNPKIKPWQVVTLASQVKSYVSTHLAQPQSTHRYFGELLESNKDKLFKQKDNLGVYFLSSLIVNRLETAIRQRKVNKRCRSFKYHITYLTYCELQEMHTKDFGIDEMIVFASELSSLNPLFIRAYEKLTATLKILSMPNKEAVRSKEFTQKLKS